MLRSTRRCSSSADAGLKPASSAEALLRAVTGCEYDLCQAFRLARAEASGERYLCRRTVLRTVHCERSRCSGLTYVQVRLRRSEENALDAVPYGRRPDARSVGPWGERRMCRAALT